MGTIKQKIVFGLFLMINSIVFSQTDFATVQKAFEKSYELESEGNYKIASDEIKKVYNENVYEHNLRLGWLNYMAGNFNESIAFYKNAIELMPYSDESKFGYIFPLSALGRWDEVIEMYNKILENSSHNTKAMYYLGTIYYSRKQYDKAIKHFKDASELYPFDYDSLYMYAWCNMQLGKKKEAKQLFQKALLNKPNDESAIEGLKYAEE